MSTKNPEGGLALSLPNAARLASVSPDLLRKAIRRGKLPARKLGRRTVVLREDLITWLYDAPTIQPREAA